MVRYISSFSDIIFHRKGCLTNTDKCIMVIVMVNILISAIYLIISFTLTLLCYKNYGKFGLYIWMCLLVIISNIQTIKLSEILGLTVSLGNISYGALFLTTDILNEKYEKKSANTSIKLSFMNQVNLIFRKMHC